ncbi:MAG: pectate lyase, partial [Verrucomicrobium sp.]
MKKIASLLSLFLALFSSARGQQDPPVSFKVREDMIQLHVTGHSTLQASTWEWRLIAHLPVPDSPWHPFANAPDAEGKFEWSLPVPSQGWDRLELRARNGDTLIYEHAWPNGLIAPLQMLTPERVAPLPQPARAAWDTYLATSHQSALRERLALAAECRSLSLTTSQPAPATSTEFEFDDKFDITWFATADASKLADVVLSYQTPSGGWSKGIDYRKGPRQPGTHWTSQSGKGWHYCGTLDNRSTTEQILFLSHVHLAHQREDCRLAVLRGVEWLFAAQFPNGGWPQVYPLEAGYHEAITLNDGAMLHALELLQAISAGSAPFTFFDQALRQRATAAYERGLQCLRETQFVIGDHPTVWCAQHDPITLAPVAARLKEPPSLSGSESAEIVRFLMRKGPLDESTLKQVDLALAWLADRRLTGLRRGKDERGKTTYTEDPTCSDPLWARFCDLQTGRPMFAG